MKTRLLLLCACLPWLPAAAAGIPADAGTYVTPGGFLLVWPRNAGFARDYSGCRTLWVMQSADDTPLLMRLYFRSGRLEAVQGFDGRRRRRWTCMTVSGCASPGSRMWRTKRRSAAS